ncbi:MAG: ABC transporter permease [Defluviitaleaceae bacterium]|nr:ABC transporter permease [Defluviitaleaceae bacterium]MCL2836206.1 ABC transporter permease [Defluviitaleaceae bacterium]
MADKITIGRILRLLAISAKMDLVWLLRDTKYAILGIAGDMVNNVATVSGVFLIASRFGGIGGMSADEVMFMMAYSTLVTGIFIMFGAGNSIHISRIIGRGQLEHLFIQPLPLGVQLMTRGFNPFTGGGNLVVGTALMALAVNRLGLVITLWWIAQLIAYLITTMVIIIARSYLVSSMAFYAPAAAEEISSTAIDGTWFMSTFPLSGMPKYIQFPMLTILPEGLMAWFPALCLLGKPPLNLTAYYPMFFALAISLAASYIFKKGLRHYVQKGSNRYLSHGFRR